MPIGISLGIGITQANTPLLLGGDSFFEGPSSRFVPRPRLLLPEFTETREPRPLMKRKDS